ncbi:hypothetical protein CFC21_071032 [Triticum aestivum]|uniref:Uncharacterized protein n=2 Tax=Triticum aestivum TaxID=4565 RepID=A0A3B6LK19_WHEAT|nr:hypothetical protein CFC21_071032 [Triticum aestivum]
MAVHQPHPGVVGDEPDDSPPIHRDAHRVPHWWVVQVELCGVGSGIEVAEALSEDEEVVAMGVDRVVLPGEDVGALEHDLHHGAVLELVHLGAWHGLPERAAHILRCVVELHRRVGGEVGGKDAGGGGIALIVCLEDGDGGGEHEGGVVDARREPCVVGAAAVLSAGAVEEADADGEEKVLVDHRGEAHRVEVAQARRERGHRGRVIVRREGRHRRARRATCAVVEDGGGGGVVEGHTLCAGVGAGGEVVPAWWLVESDEDVRGLAGPEHDDSGVVRLKVGGVSAHDGHGVAGEGDEELGVERRVDEPQQVGLAGLDREHGRVLGGAAVEVAGLAVDGDGVGDVGSCTGARGGADDVDGVHVPPLTCAHAARLLVTENGTVGVLSI